MDDNLLALEAQKTCINIAHVSKLPINDARVESHNAALNYIYRIHLVAQKKNDGHPKLWIGKAVIAATKHDEEACNRIVEEAKYERELPISKKK